MVFGNLSEAESDRLDNLLETHEVTGVIFAILNWHDCDNEQTRMEKWLRAQKLAQIIEYGEPV